MAENKQKPKATALSPFRIALIYMVFGALWISFYDDILQFLVKDSTLLFQLQTVKGWMFITITGFLVFLLASRLMSNLAKEIENRKKSELALIENEQKLLSIVNTSSVTAIISIDDEGNLTTWNPGAVAAFGYSEDEILGKPLIMLIPERYRKAHQAGLDRASETGKYNIIGKTIELSGLHKDGHEIPLELSLSVWKYGTQNYYSAIINDITERMLADQKIYQLAYTDSSTGLPNETFFLDHLSSNVEQDAQGFVAFIELSDIGDIVGTFGLEALELIIYETGTRLTGQLNDVSVVARSGERLFKILYVAKEESGDVNPKSIAERLYRIACEPFDLMGSNVFVNVYMGVCIIDPVESTPKSILTDVEIAHYEARNSTVGGIIYYNNSIKDRLVRNTQIISWLHSAIDNNEFCLFYQPQVDLKTNSIVGCEALIRWQVASGEWISPSEFIPIAERTSQIKRITSWTIAQACRTAALWGVEHDMKIMVAINISAEELASPDFLDYMTKFIDETELTADLLEVEITETALMKDAAVASTNLQKLRDMGVTIAIDDFGTGHSSLAYLKSFPIDRLKIDQSFVKDAPGDKTDQEIILSILKLAHSLGMDVIAEGVEEKEHMDMLVSLGCDKVQGFYLAKPMPADEFVEFVRNFK